MIAGVLFKNEMLKMFKRLAFWATFLSFAGIMAINYGENYVRAQANPNRTFALPDSWSSILGQSLQVATIFGSIILLLLISSEFSWRTARQNVIDGLSKEQLFSAKLMVVPTVALLFVGLNILLGGFLALLGTDFGDAGAIVGGAQVAAAGAGVLSFLGYGSLALLLAMTIRNSGPAMAVWFFYIAILEDLLASAFVRMSESLEPVVEFLPVNSFEALLRYIQWDPAAYQRAVERAQEANRTPPEIWDTGVLLLTSGGWIVLFVAVAFVWFRKRDL